MRIYKDNQLTVLKLSVFSFKKPTMKKMKLFLMRFSTQFLLMMSW